MKTIEEKATKIAHLMNPNTGLDPALLAALIDMLAEMMKLIVDCQLNPKSALDSGKKPGIVNRLLMRRIIKDHLKDVQYSSVSDIMNYISIVSYDTTEDEVKSMQAEIRLK